MNEMFYIGLTIVSVVLGIAFGPLIGFGTLGVGFIFDGVLSYLNG